MYWILDASKNIVASNLIEVAKFMNSNACIVVQTKITEDIMLSTVFLYIDHSFGNRPVLFESMWFGGISNGLVKRYHTYNDALNGHSQMLMDFINSI